MMFWLLEKKDAVTCKFSLLLGLSLAFIISFPACPTEMLSQAFPCFLSPKSLSPGCHWGRQGKGGEEEEEKEKGEENGGS